MTLKKSRPQQYHVGDHPLGGEADDNQPLVMRSDPTQEKKQTAEEWPLIERAIKRAIKERPNLDYADDGEGGINVRIIGEYIEKMARSEEREKIIEEFLDSLDTYLKNKGLGFPLKDAMIEGSVIIENLRRLKE
jgi:hypothetical protein